MGRRKANAGIQKPERIAQSHPGFIRPTTEVKDFINARIRDDQKATNDPIGTLDLMLHYVECGTEFATTYSYGDEEFYENLDEMFTKAVKTRQQSEQEVIDKFLPRLRTIVHEAEDIGWGYGDGINDTFELAFPEEV